MALYDLAGHLVRRLHQKSSQVFQQNIQEAGYDLTPVQFATMQALSTNPGIEQAQVATLIAYDRATIGGVIDRLEQKGYVTRVVSARDRRAREVSLSEKGKQVFDEILPMIIALQKDITAPLDDQESEQLLQLLKKAVQL